MDEDMTLQRKRFAAADGGGCGGLVSSVPSKVLQHESLFCDFSRIQDFVKNDVFLCFQDFSEFQVFGENDVF